MSYKLEKLANGLNLFVYPMPSLESATVTVWVRTGSRDENKRNSGISHFLEHMAFKGGKKYPDARTVSSVIDSIGGEFNASTSKEITQYFIKARKDKLDLAFDVLSDMILYPRLRNVDINREKKVIIEEMKMYEDTPIRRVWDKFEELIFEGSTLSRDIIGNKKTVLSFQREDFIKYMSSHYYAENMLITVSGGVKVGKISKFAREFFKNLKKRGIRKIKTFNFNQEKPKVKIHPKDIEQAHFILGFPADPLGKPQRYADSILNAVLGGGMSSRLFTEVREKRGLAYAVRTEFDRYLDIGYFAVYAGTDPKKAKEAIKVILDQVFNFGNRYKLTKKEFEKAKGFLEGRLALSLEDTSEVNAFFGPELLLLKKIRTPEEVFKKIKRVKIEEVLESARRIFAPKRVNLTIIGPYKNQEDFERLLV